MAATGHLFNTHRWLHDRLTERAESTEVTWVEQPDEADLLIFPVPPWGDDDAPDRRAHLRPENARRLFVFSQADNPIMWAPGVYASAPHHHPYATSMRGGFYVSYTHYESEHADALDPLSDCSLDYLWGFMGSVETWPQLRAQLSRLRDPRSRVIDTAAWNRDLRWRFDEPPGGPRKSALSRYASEIARAKFVVCPRGSGLSSIRLFEAMRAGRCPVILADGWMPPSGVEWATCSIRVAEADLPLLPDILREREGEAENLGRRARHEWDCHFSPETMLDTIARSCLDIGPVEAGRRAAMGVRASGSRQSLSRVRLRLRQTSGRA